MFRHRPISRELIRENVFKHIVARRSLILFRHQQGTTYLLKCLSNEHLFFWKKLLYEEAIFKCHMSFPRSNFIRPSFILSQLRFPHVLVTIPGQDEFTSNFFPRDINEHCLKKSVNSQSTCLNWGNDGTFLAQNKIIFWNLIGQLIFLSTYVATPCDDWIMGILNCQWTTMYLVPAPPTYDSI